MSSSLDAHYDFALLGTSLPLSILSAALSRAGFSILHIDEEEHYGGPWSSLTLAELLDWSRNTTLHQSQGKHNVSIGFPAFGGKDGVWQSAASPPPSSPAQLADLNRHFSISLAPTIVPCAGPTIDVLIRSKVASYCTFRLLQKTAVYSAQTESQPRSDWPLRRVPSSKEDIFKDKSLSLVDKRRLMKLLQQAGPGQETSEAEQTTASAVSQKPFLEYLLSKEGANLSLDLATSVSYGVALCSSEKDSTTSAMERIRRHISSIGRYGNAAYLVGQYGGAGEMAQCFCRASAVQGGTFVLGHRLQHCSRIQEAGGEEGAAISNWSLALEGIEGSTTVEHMVGDDEVLRRTLPEEDRGKAAESPSASSVSAILLLDRGIPFDDPQIASDGDSPPPETGLVVFPPHQQSKLGAVTALQMAEGTFSCPKGMYLVYLSARVETAGESVMDAREELRGARDEVIKLAGRGPSEWRGEGVPVQTEGRLLPLMECYYTTAEGNEKEQSGRDNCWTAHSSTASSIANSLDEATLQAERLFWAIIGEEKRGGAEEARRRRKPVGYTVGRGLGGVLEETEADTACDFFPPPDVGDGDDDG